MIKILLKSWALYIFIQMAIHFQGVINVEIVSAVWQQPSKVQL